MVDWISPKNIIIASQIAALPFSPYILEKDIKRDVKKKVGKSKTVLVVNFQFCTACLAVIAKSKLIQTFNIFTQLLAKCVFVEAMWGKNWQLKVLEIITLFKSFGQPRH